MPAVIRICVMKKFLCLSSLTHSHCCAMPLGINSLRVIACAFLQSFGKNRDTFLRAKRRNFPLLTHTKEQSPSERERKI